MVVLTPHNAGTTQEVIDVGLAQVFETSTVFLRGTPKRTSFLVREGVLVVLKASGEPS